MNLPTDQNVLLKKKPKNKYFQDERLSCKRLFLIYFFINSKICSNQEISLIVLSFLFDKMDLKWKLLNGE